MDAQPETPHRAPVIVKEKTRSRPAVVVLSVLLLLALAAGGFVTYLWLHDRQELDQSAAKYESLNQMSIASAKADQTSENTPNYGAFLRQYDNFLNNGVSVSQSQEKTEIEAALKTYYKLSALPEGWDVLSVYQIVKPETPATGDYYALVYWPKSDQKPAGFISMYKQKGESWKYDDRL